MHRLESIILFHFIVAFRNAPSQSALILNILVTVIYRETSIYMYIVVRLCTALIQPPTRTLVI